MIPRPVLPTEIPLPELDQQKLEVEAALEHERAQAARAQPLDANVRALGSAIRTFNALEIGDQTGTAGLAEARTELDRLRVVALQVGGAPAVLRLRAVQMEDFLAEVHRFEHTGARSQELDELGGSFIRDMVRAGWARTADGRPSPWPPNGQPVRVMLDGWARRTAFELTWAKVVGLDGETQFDPTLEQRRALYAFYLTHAHAPEPQRVALKHARFDAKSESDCQRLDEAERHAALGWLLAKMKELSAIDPGYPLGYARGIVLFQRHEYEAAAEAFRDWLSDHPDGPWSLRARNYLRTSVVAATSY